MTKAILVPWADWVCSELRAARGGVQPVWVQQCRDPA